MNHLVGGIFNGADALQMHSLEQRLQRGHTVAANIANAETPGYRALGYDFEEQLQSAARLDGGLQMNTSLPNHLRHPSVKADGTVMPEVYVRPTESIPQDGNTVDIDHEMAIMAQNQILYRGAVELLNRKVGILRYAINGGR